MELRPPDAPLDAFFARVRRRHPDVDIVVLPPQDRAPSTQPIDEAQVDATLDRVAGTAGWVWEVALRSTAAPEAGFGFGPEEGTVVASARASATPTEEVGALNALRGAMEGEGWRVRHRAGAVERLSGVRGEVRVQASYSESTAALLLEVRSEPMYVGRARARELVRR
ncbi:MAG: hypothetical protein ACRDOX_08225 [Nocardioides sp.]